MAWLYLVAAAGLFIWRRDAVVSYIRVDLLGRKETSAATAQQDERVAR